MLCAAAFTICFAEEYITNSHRYAVAGQTAGNLNLAVKISLTLCIVAVSQLARQSIQRVINRFSINRQTLAACNQVYLGILFCVLDNGVACIIGCAITCMLVENIRYAAVIINRQCITILLVDIASSFCTRTTSKFCYTAASELFTHIWTR